MSFLLTNAVPLFFGLLLVFLVYGQFKKRKDAAKKMIQNQQADLQAKVAGVHIAAHADGRVTSSDEVNGDTDYQGNTGGIDWTLRSTVLIGSSAGRSSGGSQVWKRKSMWRTRAVTLPAGKFIMLMSIPGELKTGKIERGGFMNTLLNKAADMALDIYVSGYFGLEYCPLVNIGEDGVKLEREGLKEFFILTNYEPVAQTYFDEASTRTIALWRKNNQGFAQEQQVDQFGLLFSFDGVILTCQASMRNPDEVKLFSDFGAALTIKMKGILSSQH